ncbi:hypothetical protein [uncultured Caulobacter sp.]|uniref:hypothetical protein n=1 Tax=uncultured Caulobacter sp. TaxID=158749 RepID=UPI00262EB2FC|nr:hypothetical protein [uncultured Caulobacter sp.]
MSTARLEWMMANGAMVRDRKVAAKEYARRIDRKAATLLGSPAPKANEVSVHIQIHGLVDRAAADLTKVLTRVLDEALSRIKTPRS